MQQPKAFPQVQYTDRQNGRLKNSQQNVYLCVTEGNAGYRLGTKTLQADNLADPERKFLLLTHYRRFSDPRSEFPRLLWKPKFDYSVHKSQPRRDPILGQMSSDPRLSSLRSSLILSRAS
jgi:hypothetical protein